MTIGGGMFCPQCGTQSTKDANFCMACGVPISSLKKSLGHSTTAPISRPVSPDSTVKERQATPLLDDSELYQAFIGGHNQHYYFQHFSGLQKDREYLSFNYAACFLTFYWMLYRKMWGWATAYTILVFTGFFVISYFSDADGLGLWGVFFLIGVFCLPGIKGNGLYFDSASSQIELIKTTYKGTANEQHKIMEAIKKAGGTSLIGPIIGFLFLSIISALCKILLKI